MKNFFYTLVALVSFASFAQNDWKVEYSKSKTFIENLGQFDRFENDFTGDIKYAVDFGFTKIFFGEKGVSYSFLKVDKKSKDERKKLMEEPSRTFENHKQKEKLMGKFLVTEDEVNMTWSNVNSKVEIVGNVASSSYHSYSFTGEDGEVKNINFIKSFETITYRNVYPKIDVQYQVHPEIGIKYAFIVHPGADLSKLQMLYDRQISLIDYEIHINTLFGDIIDHAPITFYQDNQDEIISSEYVNKNNRISFKLGDFDKNRTIVIDPWVQTPNDPNSNWDCVWELDHDAVGNVYVIAGIMPMQLLKYNSAGALQWTHNTPYDTTAWLGTMATDNVGNTYVTNGTDYKIQKINTAGGLVWNNNSPSGGQISTEFWNISFNCDQTKLLIGGTGGNFNIHGRVYDVDMNSGNINSSVQVTQAGNLFAIPPSIQEVRAMCAAPNGKYYFVTLDTIGYLSDNLTLCPNGSSSLVMDNHGIGWGYKSENWRYNNTGIKAIRADANFVYVLRGNVLQKRSLSDFSIIGTVNVPGGTLQSVFLGGNQSHNAGIDIDQCGNIYVGSTTGVYKFNSSLTQIGFYATTFKVWDVQVSAAGDIIACGGTGTSSTSSRTGGVQSFAASACAPLAYTCCDATVCIPEDMCVTDAPITLTPSTPGGTWSGLGVDALGNFDPAVAGVGTTNITYTLMCGSETIAFTIDPCATIDICEEANGDLTASGGDGNYSWYQGTITTSSVPINTEQECIDCPTTTPNYFFGIYTGCSGSTCSVTDTTWTLYSTGVTTSAPAGYPIQIVDGQGTVTVINNAGELVPCTANPCAGVTITMSVGSQTEPSCFGGSNGTATVSASGGTAPYSYFWMPGSLTGASQTSLSAGVYNIAIQDNAGCTGTGSVTITEPAELIASATSTPASCGLNDGTATGSATGGTGAYSYSWSPSGGTNAVATGLGPNTYTVTVTDQNGCTDDAVVSVTNTGGPTISLDNSSDVSCFGANDGSATVSATGGTPGYTYSWMPGSLTGTTQSALGPNSYTVTVTDAGGCTDQVVVNIAEPSQIQLSTSNIISASCGANDGGATVDATGGTGNYSYSWSPAGGTAATATGVPGGSYTVTVTDDSGCSDVINFTIPTTGGPTINILSTNDASCFGVADGDATIEAVGGSSPYSYAWSPTGGTAATATNLGAGSYTVTVTDAGGCISVENITISEPTEIVITESITDENCGQNDGAISIGAAGGNPSYTYAWTPNGETTNSISGLSAGNYGVTVTDASGCTSTANYSVLAVGGIPVVATPPFATILAGESVQLNATGADTYVWTPVDGLSCTTCPNPIATPTITTIYIVTGTDASGCSGSDTVTIFVTVNCGDIYVPNIFSPNADLNNDYLCVYGSCVSDMKFNVYDRWGELVFTTEGTINMNPGNYNEICWDGKFRNKQLNSGVYAYSLYAKLTNGDVVEQSGNITLVR